MELDCIISQAIKITMEYNSISAVYALLNDSMPFALLAYFVFAFSSRGILAYFYFAGLCMKF